MIFIIKYIIIKIKMKTYTIYKLYSNIDNRIYIGCSSQLIKRYKFHLLQASNELSIVYESEKSKWIRNNKFNIQINVLQTDIKTKKEALILERKYINEFKEDINFNVLNDISIKHIYCNKIVDFEKEILEYHHQKKSIAEISSILKINQSTIMYFLRKKGIRKKNSKLKIYFEEIKLEVFKMIEENISIKEISKIYNIKEKSLKYILTEYNIV